MYLWEQAQWPNFSWDEKRLSKSLALAHQEKGRLLGKMETLGFEFREEARLQALTQEVVKSSEIEGEILDKDQVRSSVARHLGMETGGLHPVDRNIEGIVEMAFDAVDRCDAPLSESRLFGWHAALFPTGHSGMLKISVGDWRDDRKGPMQVVSGPMGKEKIHYQAPPAIRLPDEMAKFLSWFERTEDIDLLIKAGLTHLWFVTVHPFEDGNGRIARTIADMVLSQSDGSRQRFYSMSAQIRTENKRYYSMLEHTQKSGMDVTPWLEWFLGCLLGAIERSQETVDAVLQKARFWERFSQEPLNERQIKVLNRVLDGFEGKLTTSKWARITKCSQDTAYRDILGLIRWGALKKNPGGGRSTSYSIVWQATGSRQKEVSGKVGF